MLVFEEMGKPEYPEKNLSEQGREPTHLPTLKGVEFVHNKKIRQQVQETKLGVNKTARFELGSQC